MVDREDNVKPLFKHIKVGDEPLEPIPYVIEVAESLLSKAKDGTMRSLHYVYTTDESAIGHGVVGGMTNIFGVDAALGHLKQRHYDEFIFPVFVDIDSLEDIDD